jgi:hypothetical protein
LIWKNGYIDVLRCLVPVLAVACSAFKDAPTLTGNSTEARMLLCFQPEQR